MDYGKLTKNALLELCDQKGLPYSSSWSKEKLEELLINEELKERETRQSNKKTTNNTSSSSNQFDKNGGAFVTQIFSMIGFVLSIMFLLTFTVLACIGMAPIIMSFFILMMLVAGVYNGLSVSASIEYRRTGRYKMAVIVFGLLNGFIGGLMVAINQVDEETIMNYTRDSEVVANEKLISAKKLRTYASISAFLALGFLIPVLVLTPMAFSDWMDRLNSPYNDVWDYAYYARSTALGLMMGSAIALYTSLISVTSAVLASKYVSGNEKYEKAMAITNALNIFSPACSVIGVSKWIWLKNNN